MPVKSYPRHVEQQMKELYQSLNERERRRYAGVEASKLRRGGVVYISQLLGCDVKTIRRGERELDDPPALPPGRIRKKGGTQVLSC
jgi:hypothetical protein